MRGVPWFQIDGAQVWHLGDDEVGLVRLARKALAGRRVLDVVEPVLDVLADVEPVVDQAALADAADDHLIVPERRATGRRDFVFGKPINDLARRQAAGVFGEDAADDPGFPLC